VFRKPESVLNGERSLALLRQMIGPGASFRSGQREAINALTDERGRLLVVQSTGWGKSAVYFIATKMRREHGHGPTLLISPLLSLMRNQIQMANRLGITAVTINSTNDQDWSNVEAMIANDACDIVLISPERLANARFRSSTLPSFAKGIGMFVVDEAHCISDWGHDFRPDYRRIVGVLQSLPDSIPVLATTATANSRVIADIGEQLGATLQVIRGPLARKTLRLQTIRLDHQAERLAWLAHNIPTLPGSGIIYCLTVADTERVARWLQTQGIDARPYNGRMQNDERVALEDLLIENKVKALVATVALGMGFDKPDLGFVVHYQRPGSVVAYYQQVGRAGRGGQDAFAILLNGTEDDDIQEYFIRTAFPTADEASQVISELEQSEGLKLGEILTRVNLRRGRVENALRHLEVEGAITRDKSTYYRTARAWQPDTEREVRVTALRRKELARMQEFVRGEHCLMEFVARELDDELARPCGRCSACTGPLKSRDVDPAVVRSAIAFLKQDVRHVEMKKQLPAGFRGHPTRRSIPPELLPQPAIVLCVYGDAGWGQYVKEGKYRDGWFSDELVEATALLLLGSQRPDPFPEWVTAVPSLRHSELVAGFAQRLARRLGLEFRPALIKLDGADEQKSMQNSLHQAQNVDQSTRVDRGAIKTGPVLLVDDLIDSAWTLTICGMKLRYAGSGDVFPVALAEVTGDIS